jgi:hypothetical protein
MSSNAKKSGGASVVLVLMGLLVLFTGEKSLIVLIPAAVLVWYKAAPKFRRTRN